MQTIESCGLTVTLYDETQNNEYLEFKGALDRAEKASIDAAKKEQVNNFFHRILFDEGHKIFVCLYVDKPQMFIIDLIAEEIKTKIEFDKNSMKLENFQNLEFKIKGAAHMKALGKPITHNTIEKYISKYLDLIKRNEATFEKPIVKKKHKKL